MAVRSQVIYRGGEPQSYPQHLQRQLGLGLRAAAEFWHRELMPGHFTVEGGRKYHYQPRKGDDEGPRLPYTRKDGTVTTRANQHYSWRKRREKRHNKPLVWSGQTEDDAKASVKLTVTWRGGRVEAKAAMDLPRYMYMYRKDLKQPDKADELTRTTPDEQLTLRDVAERHFAMANAGLGFSGQRVRDL